MTSKTQKEKGSITDEKLVEIVASADYRGMKFVEIVKFAEKEGVSRATVARHLASMVKKGILKKEKRFYKLAMEAIHWKHAQRCLFSVLSMHLFDDVLEGASTGKLSDEEFVKLFTNKIGLLAMYTLLTGLSFAKHNPKEAGKWIEEAFGTLIQKDGWRICLNRQIFGKPVPLRHKITLRQPITPEITIEDGAIYVRLPAAIEPGLAGKVLKEMPPIPEKRLKELETSVKSLYPKEVDLLEGILNQIREAAHISKVEVRK
jgi:DNA-binding transcriptional regulator YhcF (GntR family)